MLAAKCQDSYNSVSDDHISMADIYGGIHWEEWRRTDNPSAGKKQERWQQSVIR